MEGFVLLGGMLLIIFWPLGRGMYLDRVESRKSIAAVEVSDYLLDEFHEAGIWLVEEKKDERVAKVMHMGEVVWVPKGSKVITTEKAVEAMRKLLIPSVATLVKCGSKCDHPHRIGDWFNRCEEA